MLCIVPPQQGHAAGAASITTS
jgi:hypothetical protein